MSYKVNARRLRKIYNRLRSLPKGVNFFKYASNKVYAGYLKALKSTKVAYPSSIMLEVTNHCNLGCITCPREYAFGDAMNKGSMDIQKMKRVVDEVAPYIDSIGLTGLGETLIYKNLEEILRYIKQKNKGIQTFISTNAHIPGSEKIIERLSPYLDTVQISIDGIGNIYEQVRLKGDFNFFKSTTEKIVEVCNDRNVSVMFNMVAIKENYFQMKDVVRLASEMKVGFVNITPVNLASITAWNSSYYEFFSSDSFISELEEAFQVSTDMTNVELSIWDVKTKNEFKKCHLPWNHFYISWDGWLTPCCAKPFPKELNFGNVYESSLMSCLNSPAYKDFRLMWYKNITPDFCKKCHVIDLKPIDLSIDITLN